MHIPALSESEITSFLAPLGCVVRFLKPGVAGGYVDDRGEHKFVTINEYTVCTEAGRRREADAALLAKMQAHKGDNVTIYVREASTQAVDTPRNMQSGAPGGPEVLIVYHIGFARVAEDVKGRPAYVRACEDQTQVSFGVVIDAIKAGYRAARTGWNGKGMFIYYVPASSFPANRAPLSGIFGEGTQIEYRAHMDMVSADGHCVVWTVSQSDALADDWLILPRKYEA